MPTPCSKCGGNGEKYKHRSECKVCSNKRQTAYNKKLYATEKGAQARIARSVINNGIRLGTIKRRPCRDCGGRAEAHHPDHSKPLVVIWLCRKHHREEHRANET